jgi:hypothetical protein
MPTSSLQLAFSHTDENAAAAIVGGDHGLVRALMYRRSFARQALVPSMPIALGIAGTVRHGAAAPVVLAASGVVELVLAASVLFACKLVRERAQALIAEGAEDLALRVIAEERQRLLSDKERERLAHSLERLLHTAQHWNAFLPASRPPQGVHCLRFTAREVCEIVALLRACPSEARGVALTARFVRGGCGSTLYAGDPVVLREELDRIRYHLTVSACTDSRRVENRVAS